MKRSVYLFLAFCLAGCVACSDRDGGVGMQDIKVGFSSAETGFEGTDEYEDITVSLTRAAEADVPLSISFVAEEVVYGTDFTTDPAAVNGAFALEIPKGSTSAAFRVQKAEGISLDGEGSIRFTVALSHPVEGVKAGELTETVLRFGEILSGGGRLTLQGKVVDDTRANVVYVDFSNNKQTPVDRTAWDLGFYCGEEFRVILNGSYSTAATSSGKSDIDEVTLSDADAAMNIAANPMNPMGPGLDISAVDSFDGSLSGTVFAEVSENSAENMVYFVASEPDKAARSDWYKVKVDRKDGGYTVRYGKVGGTVKSIDIPKDPAYNMRFLSLEAEALVDAEPEAERWDIMWGYGTGNTAGQPYFMSDLILINNLAGVETAEVVKASDEEAYAAFGSFTFAQAAGLDYSSDRDAIGAGWRNVMPPGMPGGPPSPGPVTVYFDRFYVVKDPAGNYYKMRVTSAGLGGDGGTRGNPVVEYALLK